MFAHQLDRAFKPAFLGSAGLVLIDRVLERNSSHANNIFSIFLHVKMIAGMNFFDSVLIAQIEARKIMR